MERGRFRNCNSGASPAYRGDMEGDPSLLRLRAPLERRFEGALRDHRGRFQSVDDAFDTIHAEPAHGTGIAHFLVRQGALWHLRELAALRAVHQLRESDTHL